MNMKKAGPGLGPRRPATTTPKRYNPLFLLSRPISRKSKFERSRQDQLRRLTADASFADRLRIRRGRRAGQRLRAELEGVGL